ncbi:hypothetical protein [Cellulomonas sp. NPDC058312]|uniref:hypothetical protein n=1 Tax=Cellulomonas sp. NPDC058312 TaxID=3346441 RepID=UPI0036EEF8F1
MVLKAGEMLFRISESTRFVGVVVLVMAAVSATMVADPRLEFGARMFAVVIAQLGVLAWFSVAGSWIYASPTALESRNLVFEWRIEWAAVAAIEAADRVVVHDRFGGRHRLYAVQRATIEASGAAEPRVDRVVQELRGALDLFGARGEHPPGPVHRRLIRPTRVELVALVGVVPLGVLVGGYVHG